MIPIILIVSFFVEGIFSNLVPTDLILSPLFTLMSLILIYPYFNKNNANYYKVCFTTGLLYDLVYTDTIVFNAFIFCLIGLIIVKLNDVLANNYLNNGIMALIIIAVFRIVTYFFLLLTGNMSFDVMVLLESIYSSLVSNIIYVCLGYVITDSISRKFKIQKST